MSQRPKHNAFHRTSSASGNARAGAPQQSEHATDADKASISGWDPVARWYAQWVGKEGSVYHKNIAVPTVLELLQPRPHEIIVDVGCGTGVLASALPADAGYIGIDASPRLLATARRQRRPHRGRVRFILADAARLRNHPELNPAMADAAVFLLSIQDMEPLSEILAGAEWLLKPASRIVIVMFHPCFRVPRQSGWGWDDDRGLQYRRIDSYLSPRTVPVRPVARGRPGAIKAHHLPLEAYVNGLAEVGFHIDRLAEVPAYPGIVRRGPKSRAQNRANREIPLLLGLRAVRR